MDDWHPHPRPETSRAIIERNLKLHLEIVPPARLAELRASGKEPTVDDILPLVVEYGCGLRPGRKGGIRLGMGVYELGEGEKSLPIIYNYG